MLVPRGPFESVINKYDSTDSVDNYANAAGIGVVGGRVYINATGSVTELADGVGNTASVGAKNGSTVSVAEYGNAAFHKTVLTLTATPLTVADTGAAGSLLLYTFPTGIITFLGGSFSLVGTVTSILANTLHAASTIEVGIGTVAAAGALTTTEEDIITGATGPSSATISVAAAAILGVASTLGTVDGHSTAKTALLNVGVPTATDIDADATTTWTGTVTILWAFGGDV